MKFRGIKIRDVIAGFDERYVYYLRHKEGDWSIPTTMEKNVLVNKWGIVVLDQPIKGLETDDDYLVLTAKEKVMLLEWGD